LQQGKSDEEIRGYLVDRYGDFITYKPPVRGSTLLLWAGPFTLLLVVAVVIIWRVRRRPTEHSVAMSVEEQVRLTRILNDDLSSKG
jgi:cytochrome c-type biogenesis protein CcmH